MDEENRAWMRPRGQAWGNDAQRAVMHALAEDIARRSGFRVAAIEVVRSDGNLEFVAIAGSSEASRKLLGRAAPLLMEHIVGAGREIDGWLHVESERIGDATRDWIEQYGHTPDLPVPEHPDGWRPQDRLVRLLKSEDGELRAILNLDEPLDGRRPTSETIAAVNAEIQAMYDAIVGVVERELYGEQVRMVTRARNAMRSVPHGLSLHDFLAQMGPAMVDAIAVDSVDVLLAGDPAPWLEGHQPVLEEHMRQVWLRHGHLVLEREQTWGVTDVAVPTPPVMRKLMADRGLESWLLVPIGLGEEYLGTMGLGRTADNPRWIDSEINAAAAVAADLAGIVVGARLIDRERTLNSELRRISDSRHDMVLTLAHELRNPVSVLFTHLELLGPDVPDGEPRESIAALGRATQRIEDMVEDLMALASASDPDSGDAPTDVDVSALVRDCAEFLGPTTAASGVEMRLDVEPAVEMSGEESGLHLLVSNLLSNAIKYTPSGGAVTMKVERHAVSGRDGVLITCSDTGIGIDPSEFERVFEPFYRSRNRDARVRPGTGLGLAITDRVVSRHGGTIDVESALGEGTTFRVWMPLDRGAEPS